MDQSFLRVPQMVLSDFWPSEWQINKAEAVFRDAVAHNCNGHNSNELVVRCALAAVWQAGRVYQALAERKGSGSAAELYEALEGGAAQ
jgi:hypothetical protein